MDIKENLKNFYNQQAEKFSQSRKKGWPEFSKILDRIESYPYDNIKILEIWCWDGRFYNYLKNNSKKNIIYHWVDFSQELINIAKNNYWQHFYVYDMNNFLENSNQQSFDFVIAIASFQHLVDKKERLLVLKNIYRVLKYKWWLIMINWSFSKWFLKKFKKHLLKSFFKFIFSLWYYNINDMFLPWKDDKWQVYYRYYHIFTLNEISSLCKESWFVVYDVYYTDNNWEFLVNWKNARNSFCYAVKDVEV